uniref:Ig-like domain-containing protein n=1 Tax=Haplochromis burtoni TaxID=8153 RepID=A0A3Q2W418_HAPBU
MFYVVFYLSPAVFTEGAGVLPDGPLNAAVGEKVMFTTTLTPTETPFLSVNWNLNISKNIITSTNLVNNTGPEYEGRITFFPSTGSLELRSLTLDDIGEYSVSIVQADGTNPVGHKPVFHLLVSNLYKLSGASILLKSSTNLPAEGTSVSLTCEASGSVFTRNWMKDDSKLTLTDNMTLSDNNRVLTFNILKKKDEGEYFCNISNPVSSDGAKYVLIVNCK